MIKSEIKDILVILSMHKFDKACEMAYDQAVWKFDIDESGHAGDDRFPRSSSTIVVQFVTTTHSGSMSGQTISYKFIAWMECYEDGDD